MKNLFKKIKEVFISGKNAVKKGIYMVGTPFRKFAGTKPGRILNKGIQAVVKVVRIPFIGYLLLACILNFTMEVLSRHSVLKAFLFIKESPFVFI